MTREQVYWDANAFLGHLNGEDDKAEVCGHILQAAENGALVIVTSAITLAEVIYIKGGTKLPDEKRAMVDAFFKAEYISVRNVTRATTELARDLVWDHNIRHQDAIHVATACLYRVPVLHTYDGKLLGSDGLVVAGHKLQITKPAIVHQTDWVDDSHAQKDEK